jgi:hypothetical protein
MKPHHIVDLSLGIVALVAAGCVDQSSHPISPAVASASDQKRLPKVIDFPRRTLIFKPTRDDMTVGKVIFNLYCSNPDEVRVNGVKPDPTWRQVHLTPAGDVVVDERGIARDRLGGAWMFIALRPISTNQFELAPLKIEFSDGEQSGYLCMSIKLWFNEVGNDHDGQYYEHQADRFDLLSYRTTQVEPPNEVNWQFRENRVATVDEFKEIVSRPFVIRLNQRPLGAKPTD